MKDYRFVVTEKKRDESKLMAFFGTFGPSEIWFENKKNYLIECTTKMLRLSIGTLMAEIKPIVTEKKCLSTDMN